MSLGLSEVSEIFTWPKTRPLSFQYSGNTKALPEIFSMIPVCDFLCPEDGRCKQLPTSYQKYWSQRTHSVWEWINNAPSKPAAVCLVPTFGSDKKKLPSEAQVGHLFCSSLVCEGLFLSERFTHSHHRMFLILMTERYMPGLEEGAIDLFSPLFSGWQRFKREGTS